MIQLYGLSLIYLLIHSFKFPLMFFTYPYWIFMLSAGYIFLTVNEIKLCLESFQPFEQLLKDLF